MKIQTNEGLLEKHKVLSLLKLNFAKITSVKPLFVQIEKNVPLKKKKNGRYFDKHLQQQFAKHKKVFGNCQVFNTENKLISYVDAERIFFYLTNDLAEGISDNPIQIKLKFRTKADDLQDYFGAYFKENKCVVCGSDEYLTRHHVIPNMFTKLFPCEIKEHNSYDILPVCKHCHEEYETKALLYKKQMKIDDRKTVPQENKILTIKKIAYTLAMCKLKEERISELRQKLSTLTDETDLEKLNGIPLFIENKDYNFDKFMLKIKNIDNFAKLWRKHFISNMNPKFLPEYYDINKSYSKVNKRENNV